jgi:hypothetical protein
MLHLFTPHHEDMSGGGGKYTRILILDKLHVPAALLSGERAISNQRITGLHI